MARRKKCQHEIHAVFVQELPVCYHPDDFYLDYAVQGLSEAGYHLLHDSFGICRCGSCNAADRKDVQLCCYRRYTGTYRYDYQKRYCADG